MEESVGVGGEDYADDSRQSVGGESHGVPGKKRRKMTLSSLLREAVKEDRMAKIQ